MGAVKRITRYAYPVVRLILLILKKRGKPAMTSKIMWKNCIWFGFNPNAVGTLKNKLGIEPSEYTEGLVLENTGPYNSSHLPWKRYLRCRIWSS